MTPDTVLGAGTQLNKRDNVTAAMSPRAEKTALGTGSGQAKGLVVGMGARKN